MPLYEYKCLKCGRRTEKIEHVSGPHLRTCPHCRGKVERLLAAPAIQFKGGGWYVTDYAGKKSEAEAEKGEKPATETKETITREAETGTKEAAPKGAKEKKPTKRK